MDEWITIRTFSYSSDALVPKSFLESREIECNLTDELMSVLHPAAITAGGIQLQVRKSQLEDAIEILKEGGYLKEEDLNPSGIYEAIGKILSKFGRKPKA